jgi:hypothetical protein
MTKHPRATGRVPRVRGEPGTAARRRGLGTDGQRRLVGAPLIAISRGDLRPRHPPHAGGAENARSFAPAYGTRGRRIELAHRSLLVEKTVSGALVLVDGHAFLYLAIARSVPEGTIGIAPDVGFTSNVKISVGIASVAHAFGMSTIPLIRPSTGAVPKIAYA